MYEEYERADFILDKNYYRLVNDIFNNCLKKVPIAFVKTYGCQQNVSDSEKIRGILRRLGYTFTDDENVADLIILNTCAIRQNAQNRVLGNLGIIKNIKEKHPDKKIIVCGCMTEQKYVVDEIKNKYSFVDAVMGTDYLMYLPKIIYNLIVKDKKILLDKHVIEDISAYRMMEDVPIERDSKIKAFVPIMYGCDNFCSYCVVPYVRGRERSRTFNNIESEVNNLIKNGYKEIMLLGQNVNSYGKHLDEKIDFPSLLERLDNIKGKFRIRFMTSHPKDATKKLIDVIAKSKHICHNIHLPFQSGNDEILKRMNRKYTRSDYLKIVSYAREKIPDIHITSDVIVGFPGETYEAFLDTVSLIKEVKFSSLFTFIYSPRNGTQASLFDDFVKYEEKIKWFSDLLKEQERIEQQIYENMIGKNVEILIENFNISKNLATGKSDGNIQVEVETSDKNLVGKFVNVRILSYNKTRLKAVIN